MTVRSGPDRSCPQNQDSRFDPQPSLSYITNHKSRIDFLRRLFQHERAKERISLNVFLLSVSIPCMWLDWMTIIIMWRHQSYAGLSHTLIGVGGERITLMIGFQQKTKKMTFCAFNWSQSHLPSSRDHVDIHKQVKLCPLVPSGAVKIYLTCV